MTHRYAQRFHDDVERLRGARVRQYTNLSTGAGFEVWEKNGKVVAGGTHGIDSFFKVVGGSNYSDGWDFVEALNPEVIDTDDKDYVIKLGQKAGIFPGLW